MNSERVDSVKGSDNYAYNGDVNNVVLKKVSECVINSLNFNIECNNYVNVNLKLIWSNLFSVQKIFFRKWTVIFFY